MFCVKSKMEEYLILEYWKKNQVKVCHVVLYKLRSIVLCVYNSRFGCGFRRKFNSGSLCLVGGGGGGGEEGLFRIFYVFAAASFRIWALS